MPASPAFIIPSVALQQGTIPLPHRAQAPLVFGGTDKSYKFIMAKCGRRFGKTAGLAIRAARTFMKAAERLAQGGDGKGGHILYAAPSSEQTDRFWAELTPCMKPAVDSGILRQNENERFVQLRGTDLRIKAKTAWNANTLRGDYADLLILDEFQMMHESVLDSVGWPMLLDNDGDLVVIYTPPYAFGSGVGVIKASDPLHAYKMWQRVESDPEWLRMHATSHDNPFLPRAGLERLASQMSPLQYRIEIMAEDVDEDPNALWSRAMFGPDRYRKVEKEEMSRIVIGVDPTGTAKGDECGIVVAGKDRYGNGHVMADLSAGGMKPDQWARKVVDAYHKYKADRIVAEVNYGGDMVRHTIRTVDKDVAFREVHASRGKAIRAEPIAAMYEQDRVFHAEPFLMLETQMCMWTPEITAWSPDRMDAAVWALSDLMLKKRQQAATPAPLFSRS